MSSLPTAAHRVALSPAAIKRVPRPSAMVGDIRVTAAGEAVRRTAVLVIVVAPFAALFAALWQLWGRAVGWTDVALLVGTYIPISLGVTAGFHRMLTHRSFRAHPAVQFLLLVLGSMAIEGPALTWASDHKKHHRLSDQAGDPHSPLDGLWHSHIGWMLGRRETKSDPNHYCRALKADPIIRFVDRTFFLWATLSLVIPFLIGGWQGLLWGGLVRVFFVHHITWSVNSVCHTWGSRPYETTDRSQNNWLVGLLAMGEGFHNNHHRWPRAAIHGMDRFQFDASALFIQALERIGLVSEVCRISAETRRRVKLRVLPEHAARAA